jgi:Fe2+ or Zn2+ uptake regulation protein
MRINEILTALRNNGLKDTQPRRLVIEALAASAIPLAPAAIAERTTKAGRSVNIVTVYRVIEALEHAGVAHRHPCGGGYTLCALPGQAGHHGFLHCSECGTTEEFSESSLPGATSQAASAWQLSNAHSHIEIHGRCPKCA